jgi:hypothetical protein
LSAQHDNKNSEAEKISLENAPTSFCLWQRGRSMNIFISNSHQSY